MTESKDRMVESGEQDQTARMCRLILLYTLRKVSSWSRKSRIFFYPFLSFIYGVVFDCSTCRRQHHYGFREWLVNTDLHPECPPS